MDQNCHGQGALSLIHEITTLSVWLVSTTYSLTSSKNVGYKKENKIRTIRSQTKPIQVIYNEIIKKQTNKNVACFSNSYVQILIFTK